MSGQTRGERNNNPGNIDRVKGVTWQGQAADQSDPRFIVFSSPEYGIRALAKVLLTYQDTHGCQTIEQIINRWAPPGENNTSAYVAAVASDCGVAAGAAYPLHEGNNLYKITKAIIEHENGRVSYSDQQLAVGIGMALQTGATMATPAVPVTPPAPESGMKSSELKLVGVLIAAMTAASASAPDKIPPEFVAAVSAGLGAIYAILRTGLKMIHAWGYLKNVKDLPPAQGGL